MLKRIVLRAIRFYRKGVSPFTPAACRYTPTCSRYAEEALEVHGLRRGSWLALRRVLRCHPFGGRGYDPVPGSGEWEAGWSADWRGPRGKAGMR